MNRYIYVSSVYKKLHCKTQKNSNEKNRDGYNYVLSELTYCCIGKVICFIFLCQQLHDKLHGFTAYPKPEYKTHVFKCK